MLQARSLAIAVAGRQLIRSLDMQLAPGARCALLGRNGTGKTSLLLALSGLRAPASGEVLLAGRPLASFQRLERARCLGILLQDETGDFWGSTLEFVGLGRYPHGERHTDHAHSAALLAELDLSNHADQPYRTLSGGEQQRARIARLLAQDPAVMLLDEPLRNLDPAHQAGVLDALERRAARGSALLMALHEPALAARHCDRAVLLYDPARIEHGPANALLTRENLEALYQCRLEPAAGFFVPLAR